MKYIISTISALILVLCSSCSQYHEADVVIKVSAENIEMPCEGGEELIKVTFPCDYYVKSGKTWVKILASSLNAGDSEFTIIIAANTSTSARTAIVSIYNDEFDIRREIAITQEASGPFITVEPEKLYISYKSQKCKFSVNSNIDYEIKSDSEWCQVPSIGSEGQQTLTVTVAKNNSTNSRTATITLSNKEYIVSKKIVIKQEEWTPTLTPEKESLQFGCEGGEQVIKITSDVEFDVTESVDWLSVEKTSTGVKIQVAASNEADSRTAKITIRAKDYDVSKTIKVAQDGLPETYLIRYTSSDNAIVEPYSGEQNDNADAMKTFGANIVSNTYEDNKGVIIFDAPVTSIGSCAFYCRKNLTSISIASSATKIGYKAFEGCSSLTSVTIPDSVTSIGTWVFHNAKLKEITIPDSVTEVGEAVFASTPLEYIYGKFASADNRCLVVDGTLVHMSSYVPEGNYTLPESVTYIGHNSISHVKNVISITVPESVIDCAVRPSVGTQNVVAFYGKFAANSNRALIKDGILLAAAYYGVTEYNVPEGVSTIREYTFYLAKINKIVLPTTTTKIKYKAFYACKPLEELYCKATTPPTLGNNAFSSINNTPTIYVPRSSVEAYKTAKGWSEYADYIEGYDF